MTGSVSPGAAQPSAAPGTGEGGQGPHGARSESLQFPSPYVGTLSLIRGTAPLTVWLFPWQTRVV